MNGALTPGPSPAGTAGEGCLCVVVSTEFISGFKTGDAQ